jgi:uncharacterized protein (TIGR02246 family)
MKRLVFATTLTAFSILPAMVAAQNAAAGIAETSERFEAAYNSGDAAAMAELYTEDGALLPPGAARVDGREGIAALWQGYMDAGVQDLDLETVEIEDHGDSASEVGIYTLTVPDGEGGRVTGHGKYIVLWQRGEDGVWRLHRDIWNDTPAE